MIEGKYLTDADDMSEIKALWNKVLIEELHMPQTAVDYEETSLMLHAIAMEQGETIGTGTIEYGEEAFYISRIVVVPEKRRMKYGDFLLRMLINKVVLSGSAMPVRADVTIGAKPLFEEVGFEKTGDEVTRDGIVYQPYTLSFEKMRSCGCDCHR